MKENQSYPEYIGISDIATRSAEQMRVEGLFEGQPSIMFDEPEGFDIGDPPDLRGRSRGWTPVHAQLAALAACTSITVAVVARDQKFRFAVKSGGLRTKIRSLIDIRGFFFDLHLQPQYVQINFDLYVHSRESTKRLRALANEVDRRCPQIGLFLKAGIPMMMTWYREGEEKPTLEDRFFIEARETPEEALIRAERSSKKPRKRPAKR